MNLLFYVILMVLSLAENMNEKMNVGMPGTSVSADVDVGASADVAVGASGEVAVAGLSFSQTSGTWCSNSYGPLHSELMGYYFVDLQHAKTTCYKDRSCMGLYSSGCRKNNYLLCRSSGSWRRSSVGSCVFKKAAGTVTACNADDSVAIVSDCACASMSTNECVATKFCWTDMTCNDAAKPAEAYLQTSGKHCTFDYGYYPSFNNAKNACNRDRRCVGIYSWGCRKNNYRLCRSSGSWRRSSRESCVFKKAAGTVEEEVGDCWKDCMGKYGNEDVCGKQCANAEEEVGVTACNADDSVAIVSDCACASMSTNECVATKFCWTDMTCNDAAKPADGDHYEELLEMRKTMTQMDYEFEAQKYMDAIKEREGLEDDFILARKEEEEEEEEEAKQKEQEKSSSEDEESVNPEFSVGTGGYVNLEERTMSEKVFSFEGGVLVFMMGCIASGLYTIRCTSKKQDNEFHMLQEEL